MKTIAEIMQDYMSIKEIRSQDRCACAWLSLRPVFGHLCPNDVSAELCTQYIEMRRQQNRGNGTIRREIGILRAAINRFYPENSARFKLPPPPPARDRYLTQDEFARLLKASRASHLRLFTILAVATAARRNALLELTWDRVDMQNRLITLACGDMHRRKPRATVPMTSQAYEALKQAKKTSQCAWVIEYKGKPIKNIKNSFARACMRAGLSGVSPHVLRHTSAVWMIQRHTTISEIARFLGHKDSSITERVYLKYSPDYLCRASDRLGHAIGEAMGTPLKHPYSDICPQHSQETTERARAKLLDKLLEKQKAQPNCHGDTPNIQLMQLVCVPLSLTASPASRAFLVFVEQ